MLLRSSMISWVLTMKLFCPLWSPEFNNIELLLCEFPLLKDKGQKESSRNQKNMQTRVGIGREDKSGLLIYHIPSKVPVRGLCRLGLNPAPDLYVHTYQIENWVKAGPPSNSSLTAGWYMHRTPEQSLRKLQLTLKAWLQELLASTWFYRFSMETDINIPHSILTRSHLICSTQNAQETIQNYSVY